MKTNMAEPRPHPENQAASAAPAAIVFFDGTCALCHGFVKFLVRHDRAGLLHYAPLSGATFAPIKAAHPRIAEVDSLVLNETGKGVGRVSVESAAALRAIVTLGGWWRVAGVFLLVPAVIRDVVYRLIARNRFRMFGRVDACDLPPPDVARRLLP